MITIAAGFVFYIWACVNNVVYLIALIVITYLFGKIICHTRSLSIRDSVCKIIYALENTSFALAVVAVGIIVAVFSLYHFKYNGQISFSAWNMKSMSMPLGISFLTFSVISYLVDVYKGADPGTFMDVALYISFFPKVISVRLFYGRT